MEIEGSQSALEAPSSEFQQNESSPPLKSTSPPGGSSFSRKMHCSYMHKCCDCGCLLRSVVLDLLCRLNFGFDVRIAIFLLFLLLLSWFNANLASLMFHFPFLWSFLRYVISFEDFG